MTTSPTTLTACPACGASAEGCQPKHHLSGRACCPDCHHVEQEGSA